MASSNPFFGAAPGFAMQDPSIMSDQTALDRQMQLAQLLRQQSLSGFGPTEYPNGYAVKRSPLEGIAKVVQALMAGKMDKENDASRLSLAQKQGTAMQSMMAGLLGGNGGGAPQKAPDPSTMGGGDGMAASPDSPPTAQQGNPQVAQLKRAATSAMLMGNTDLANKLIGNLMELTTQQKDWGAQGIDPRQMAPYTMGAAVKGALHEAQPGATTTNLATNQSSFNPRYGEGMVPNPGAPGAAMAQPGYAQGAAALTGANAQATEDAKLIDVDVGGGKTVKMPAGQYRQMMGGQAPGAGPQVQYGGQGMPLGQAMANNGDGAAVYNIGGQTGVQQSSGPIAQARAAGTLGVKDPVAEQIARTYGTKKAEAAVAYGTELSNKVGEGQDLMSRVAEMRKALEGFKPGMGAENRLNAARAAEAIGLPDDWVKKIAGGEISSLQEFEKISAQSAMQSLKQAMGPGQRMTQAEFKVFLQNNPSIALSKPAMEGIFNFMQGQYKRDFAEQQAREQYLDGGNDPSRWPAQWSRMIDPTGRGNIDLVRAPPPAVAARTGGAPASAPKVRRFNPATGLIE